MLEFIRPVRSARSLLKWEGILIDPVGAILAVVAFNALDFSGGASALALQGDFVETMAAGLLCGVAGALVLMPLLAAGWLAERQKVAATLMAVVAAFAAGDLLKQDAGLVATIVMGIVLANQRRVDIARIVEFKETLGAILLGILFVLLAAQVQVSDVVDLGVEGIVVVLVAVVLVRPLVVLAATARTGVPWRERVFAAGLAPRGIVAASTASVFGLELVAQGAPGADKIVPVTFLVIAGTVILYAIASPLLASGLRLRHGEPAGVLLIGAPPWARDARARAARGRRGRARVEPARRRGGGGARGGPDGAARPAARRRRRGAAGGGDRHRPGRDRRRRAQRRARRAARGGARRGARARAAGGGGAAGDAVAARRARRAAVRGRHDGARARRAASTRARASRRSPPQSRTSRRRPARCRCSPCASAAAGGCARRARLHRRRSRRRARGPATCCSRSLA